MQVYLLFGTVIVGAGLAVFFFAKRIGGDAEKIKAKDETLETLKREADAASNAPTSRDALIDRLRNGGVL